MARSKTTPRRSRGGASASGASGGTVASGTTGTARELRFSFFMIVSRGGVTSLVFGNQFSFGKSFCSKRRGRANRYVHVFLFVEV